MQEIIYTNHFEFNGRLLAYRYKLLFDITDTPRALYCANNKGFFGYWIDKHWLNENKISEIIKNEPITKDVSNLEPYHIQILNNWK